MAYSPSLVPAVPPPESPDTPHPTPDGEVEIMTVLSALSESLSDSKKHLDAISAEIAEAAHRLTGANATALAIRSDGVVTCRGRSGELAPEIGTRLSVDSGISGECLRTGKVLRCDDAFKDFRADPEVCRRLGLRSIAAVPLRGTHGTTGVLEAFSTHAYAFADEHMDALRRLAELAEQARVRERANSVVPQAAAQTAAARRLAVISVAVAEARSVAAARSRDVVAFVRNQLRNSRIRTGVAISAFALLLMLSVAVWRPWRKAAPQPPVAAAPAQPAADTPAVPDAKADLVWRPPAASKTAGKTAKSQPSSSEPADVVTKVAEPSAPAATSTETTSSDSAAPPADVTADPKVYVGSAGKPLGSILSGPAQMPQLTVPVSTGVTEGVLVRRVPPIYPAAALPLRLEGAVVLKATIGQDGRVRNVSAVSGHPALTRAAIAAVKEWRYKPYLLNGKPVPMQTEITVNFKQP
ncbi:MAG TPA: TonB family protein [Terriglobales bacterium]|nr:TonB family protein [Terriglobales bacterium]